MTTEGSISRRDYAALALSLKPQADRAGTMAAVVDTMWDVLSPTGVSWLGFYLQSESGDELVLGARRDKPACSPIGLHGVCGRSFLERRAVIVRDVRVLGEDYVACDPRDLSEVVVPLIDRDGMCSGVLDLDSFEVGSFGPDDAAGLASVLVAGGLSADRSAGPALLL